MFFHSLCFYTQSQPIRLFILLHILIQTDAFLLIKMLALLLFQRLENAHVIQYAAIFKVNRVFYFSILLY